MIACETIRPELPGYVAGELDDEHRRAVEAHLSVCNGCAREVAEIRELTDLVSLGAIERKPREDLEDQVFGFVEHAREADLVAEAPLEHTPPDDLERRSLEHAGVLSRADRWWNRTAPRVAPVLAVASLMLAAMGVNWRDDAQTFRSEVAWLEGQYGDWGDTIGSVTMVPDPSMPDAEVEATLVRAEQENYRIVLYGEALPPPPEGTYYEVWLVGDEGRVACGSFTVNKIEAHVPAPLLVAVNPLDYPVLQISLEPEGGKPGMDGHVVMEAELAAVTPE